MALGKSDHPGEALEAFTEALEFNPNIALVWYNEENAHRFLPRDHEEIKAFERALPIDPGLHEAWSSRAFGLARSGKFEEAIQEFEKELGLCRPPPSSGTTRA